MKKAIRILLLLAGIFLLYIVVVLLHGTLSDYQPEDVLPSEVAQSADQTVVTDSLFRFLIWNLGYGGLGEESDFFYEESSLFSKGMMIRPSKEIVEKNIQASVDLAARTKVDFFLFQEVDYDSRRSYHINQFKGIADTLKGWHASFSPNYKVARVPVPILEPWRAYGQVVSGLGTYSSVEPRSATRLQLPGNFGWPTRIFMLDRCAAEYRYALANGKELVVFNIHNSAYDDGSLKAQQMDFLRQRFLKEYEQGNYVVAGGDWNQCPPYFRFDGFMPGRSGTYQQYNIPAEYMPDNWRWAYDATVPTNRKINEPFEKGQTFVTLIDFYLVSPNLQIKMVKGINQDFAYSDHHPVYLEVELQ